jgi:hypothetical protein
MSNHLTRRCSRVHEGPLKFSKDTVTVIKNFAAVNQEMLFREGNVLRVQAHSLGMVGRANIPDTIDKEFIINNLPKFVQTLSLFDDPEIKVTDTSVVISEGRSRASFTQGDGYGMKYPPDRDPGFPDPVVSFVLSKDTLAKMTKGMSVLKLDKLCVKGNGELLLVQGMDSKGVVHDTYTTIVGETEHTLNAIIDLEYLSVIPMDYRVDIAKKGDIGVAHLVGAELGLEYWFALNAKSDL